jgi:uncharacterized protein (DUF4415 family)
MRKKEHIVRYSAEEIATKLASGEDRTDWDRVRATPQLEIDRLADEEDGSLSDNWKEALAPGLPLPKKSVQLRLDADILDWFRAGGHDYQRRINSVLRAFVEARRRVAAAEGKQR